MNIIILLKSIWSRVIGKILIIAILISLFGGLIIPKIISLFDGIDHKKVEAAKIETFKNVDERNKKIDSLVLIIQSQTIEIDSLKSSQKVIMEKRIKLKKDLNDAKGNIIALDSLANRVF